MKIEVRAFYRFVSLPDYEQRREALLEAMHLHEIKGTIILATEGINGGIAGSPENIASFWGFLTAYQAFDSLPYKVSYDDENPYDKAKVKLRKEIVTLGVEGIDPSQKTGVLLSPEEWNQFLKEEDVLVIDTRNTYEIEKGSFKNAIDPNTRNFRDFPEYVEKHLMDQKDKKVLMYCTGGIRCEKSTAYLLKLGFKDVYHLEGGVLNYLEKIPESDSLWQGECFVFDNRVVVDHSLEKVPGAVSTKWRS